MGLEPMTFRLKVECSSNWANGSGCGTGAIPGMNWQLPTRSRYLFRFAYTLRSYLNYFSHPTLSTLGVLAKQMTFKVTRADYFEQEKRDSNPHCRFRNTVLETAVLPFKLLSYKEPYRNRTDVCGVAVRRITTVLMAHMCILRFQMHTSQDGATLHVTNM